MNLIIDVAGIYCAVWTLVTTSAIIAGYLHWGKKG